MKLKLLQEELSAVDTTLAFDTPQIEPVAKASITLVYEDVDTDPPTKYAFNGTLNLILKPTTPANETHQTTH